MALSGIICALGLLQEGVQNVSFLQVPIILHPLLDLLKHVPLPLISQTHEEWLLE